MRACALTTVQYKQKTIKQMQQATIYFLQFLPQTNFLPHFPFHNNKQQSRAFNFIFIQNVNTLYNIFHEMQHLYGWKTLIHYEESCASKSVFRLPVAWKK